MTASIREYVTKAVTKVRDETSDKSNGMLDLYGRKTHTHTSRTKSSVKTFCECRTLVSSRNFCHLFCPSILRQQFLNEVL